MMPWDIMQNPYTPIFGIVNEPAIGYQIGNDAWSSPSLASGIRVFSRVRSWATSGKMRLQAADSFIEGPFVVILKPIDYDGNEIFDEIDILKLAGWEGSAEAGNWSYWYPDEPDGPLVPHDFDAGLIYMKLWPSVFFPVTIEGGTEPGIVFPKPQLLFYPSGEESVQFGYRIPADDCTMTCTFPTTYDGKFDGTEMEGFTLRLGSPGPGNAYLTGNLTLEPSFWMYIPPGGSGGPYYDPLSGKWLRTPEGYDPMLVEP